MPIFESMSMERRIRFQLEQRNTADLLAMRKRHIELPVPNSIVLLEVIRQILEKRKVLPPTIKE
jgi:hypothetical protein